MDEEGLQRDGEEEQEVLDEEGLQQVGEQRDEGPQRAERLGSQWLEQEVLDEEGLQ